MADTRGIDRFFDRIDGIIDNVDRGINGVKRVEEAKAQPKTKSARSTTPSSSTAISKRRFRIEEVTDATTGAVTFIVTDGRSAKCEVDSRATAEKLCAMLEAST